jgi:hypothetical protein
MVQWVKSWTIFVLLLCWLSVCDVNLVQNSVGPPGGHPTPFLPGGRFRHFKAIRSCGLSGTVTFLRIHQNPINRRVLPMKYKQRNQSKGRAEQSRVCNCFLEAGNAIPLIIWLPFSVFNGW